MQTATSATPTQALAPTPSTAQPVAARLTDAEISARSTKHAAWVAAAAAILAAVLALGGTWWSGQTAAKSALETVERQTSAETEKSKAEFLRGQRQALYNSAFLREQTLFDIEEDWAHAILEQHKALGDEKSKAWYTTYNALRADTSSMAIIASMEAYQAFVDLMSKHLEAATICNKLPTRPNDPDFNRKLAKEWTDNREAQRRSGQTFLDIVRRDLGQ
jgi:hypothetical protein